MRIRYAKDTLKEEDIENNYSKGPDSEEKPTEKRYNKKDII